MTLDELYEHYDQMKWASLVTYYLIDRRVENVVRKLEELSHTWIRSNYQDVYVAAKAFCIARDEYRTTGDERRAVQKALMWKLANGGAL